MFSFKQALKFLLGKGDVNVEEETFDDDPIFSLIENVTQNHETKAEEVKCPPKQSVDLLQHRTGCVTKLLTDTGVIDHKYHFNLSDCYSLNIEVGSRVTYHCYRRHENEEWRVTKIISVHEENWNDDDVKEFPNIDAAEEEPSQVHSVPANVKRLLGEVVGRNGREVTLSYTSQSAVDRRSISKTALFNLDKVVSVFIPQEGDIVSFEAVVEIDSESVNLSGDVAEVLSVRPQRARMDDGIVTTWRRREQTGKIDDVFFDKDACASGYFPKVNDSVKVEALENSRHGWRAILVEPAAIQQEKYDDDDDIPKKKFLPSSIDPELAENKNHVVVSEDTNLGRLNLGENKELQISVTNNGKSNRTINKSYFKSGCSQLQIKQQPPYILKQTLTPGQTVNYRFMCCPSTFGYSDDVFVIDFNGFQIGRLISWEVISEQLQDSTMNGTPIQQFDRKNDKMLRSEIVSHQQYLQSNRHLVVPGVKLKQSPNFVPLRMQKYAVPKHFTEVLSDEKLNVSQLKKALQSKFPSLVGSLTSANYKDRFHLLLYVLEVDAGIDLGRYNMKRASFRRSGEYLALEVQGLAEKRPSVLAGDSVIAVRSSEGEAAPHFEGCIHKLHKNELLLKFNPHFHSDYNGEDYNIDFQLSRSSYNKWHYAVDLSLSRQALVWLFPDSVSSKPPHIKFQDIGSYSDNLVNGGPFESSANYDLQSACHPEDMQSNRTNVNCHSVAIPSKISISKAADALKNAGSKSNKPAQLKWVNPKLNARQKDAVRNILLGEGRPLPFIIFGPPGTGKTITLVEAILQVFLLKPDSRILVATPSNSSADLIAERLLDSGKVNGEMVRIVGFHVVQEGKVPPRLIEHCATVDINANAPDQRQKTAYGIFSCSGVVLGRHRITVGTCGTVGNLHALKFSAGHFSHVFVDEAGQATEPEVLLPLGFLTINQGQSILAGDPHQLGPVVPSRVAAELGYNKSLLARLLPRFPYKRDPVGFPETGGYDPRLVTRLNVNYRSLPDILELPSSLFYDSELEAKIQEEDSYEANFLASFTKSSDLPHSAVIFHGVKGVNSLENDSPSWFNLHELYETTKYMTKLVEFNVDVSDIGIITPYQKQVQKLRIAFEKLGLPVPKIGSVEEFQGQERLVIIVSTVRSNKEMIRTDIKHSLGFVSCKERLNVAISRARALLIIIGNPYVLSLDYYWRSVLQYCIDRNSYTGCSYRLEGHDN